MLTAHCLKVITEEGQETELVRLAGLDIRGCNACGYCFKNEGCSIEDDAQAVFAKMVAADAVIVASPVRTSPSPSSCSGSISWA
jgi:multimeric flavodoxin WrbA